MTQRRSKNGRSLRTEQLERKDLLAFDIAIIPTFNLLANPQALAAFNSAAERLEAFITDDVTININADFMDLGPGILGGTARRTMPFADYDVMRAALIADAEAGDAIVNSLPTKADVTFDFHPGFIPTGGIQAQKAVFKALGFPNLDLIYGPSDGLITFNSIIPWDFDPTDGITPGFFDFQGTAIHELIHALGFVSEVDTIDFFQTIQVPQFITPAVLDLFRFQDNTPGLDPQTPQEFHDFTRSMRVAVEAITDDISQEFNMSTGSFLGDGNQASHWKDDFFTGVTIGIMDPTGDPGVVDQILPPDLRALDLIGYDINLDPTAVADSAVTQEDTPVAINVLANDTDPDGGFSPSGVIITSGPFNGTAVVNPATGVVTYTPNANFNGADQFTYQATDVEGKTTGVVAVNITVTPVDDAPVANNDTAVTTQFTPVVIDVLANDVDVDSTLDPDTVQIVQAPVSGITSINPLTGAITYTPSPLFVGGDVIKYQVRDAAGTISNVAEVNIRVGDPVAFAGVVYFDANNNGIQDPGEQGLPNVEVRIQKVDGPLRSTVVTRTAPDGTYFINEALAGGQLLPAGVYDLSETQPIPFIDGLDTPGVPGPLGLAGNDFFSSIVLAPGQLAAGYQFGERGLKFEFLQAASSSGVFLASLGLGGLSLFSLGGGAPPSQLNLSAGSVWISLDGGWDGAAQFTVTSSPLSPPTTLTLYNENLQPLYSTTGTGGVTSLTASSQPGTPHLLKISGGNSLAMVTGSLLGSDTVANAASGIDTLGTYQPGSATFFLRSQQTSGVADVATFNYGLPGWTPLVGDWNGDGVDTVGVYNPQTATFFLANAYGGTADVVPFNYGLPGWTPIVGDWNGDGIDTVGVYNQQTATYFLSNSNSSGVADLTFNYGLPGWTPVAGDWDGNGTDTIGSFNAQSGTFFLRNANSAGVADTAFNYGGSGWTPVAGDWDGDGTDTIGVVDPLNATFYLRNANSGGVADVVSSYGGAGWVPLVGSWATPNQAATAVSPSASTFVPDSSAVLGLIPHSGRFFLTDGRVLPAVPTLELAALALDDLDDESANDIDRLASPTQFAHDQDTIPTTSPPTRFLGSQRTRATAQPIAAVATEVAATSRADNGVTPAGEEQSKTSDELLTASDAFAAAADEALKELAGS